MPEVKLKICRSCNLLRKETDGRLVKSRSGGVVRVMWKCYKCLKVRAEQAAKRKQELANNR